MDKGFEYYNRFLDGDEQALEELIRDYKDGLIFYLNSFTCNIHTAEELAEETFVKLFTRKPPFKADKNGSSFKTWLYTIGRNTAFDYLRSIRRRRQVSEEEYVQLAAEEDSLEHSYIREEQRITLHKAMAKLKPQYRQILWLVYFEELSHKEAARIMKKPVGSIKTLVFRARQELKGQLEKEGFDYNENL